MDNPFRVYYDLQATQVHEALRVEKELDELAKSQDPFRSMAAKQKEKDQFLREHCCATFQWAASRDSHLEAMSGTKGHPEVKWDWGKQHQC